MCGVLSCSHGPVGRQRAVAAAMGPATGRWLQPTRWFEVEDFANRFVQEETVTNEPGFCPVATALWAVNERGCRDGTGHRPVATTHCRFEVEDFAKQIPCRSTPLRARITCPHSQRFVS